MNKIKDVYGKQSEYSIQEIMSKYSNSNINSAKPMAWNGFKEFIVVKKIRENNDVISFYFKPKDKSKLLKHKPGQFFTIKLNSKDEKYKDEIRTYSLSMMPNEEFYRISVKKVPSGLISNYLHDKVEVGDIIYGMVPMGLFTINENNKEKPLILISGGIGITPLISMLYEEVEKRKEIFFVQAIQNSDVETFKDEMKEIMKNRDNVRNIVFYSNPKDDDSLGKDYDFKGRVDYSWIKNNLPLNGDFYFCGPPPFMKGIYKALKELGVKEEYINFEFFGPKQDMID
ncbi:MULTISPECIES: FAD-binding oxidoreductase [Clostridium]|uniref:nitric oxide dioxygenase n=1 Tax=Clostridium senegalense TaxID=1465809 RepID=A0A6M0H8S2_9CLOT|nr:MULTISPECIES: FAD-binding oxidoreductase [Clostridium]NEU05992.1 oxidoreductase [Clostridium senegalense]